MLGGAPPLPTTLSLSISPLFPLSLSQMEESLLDGDYDGGGVCMYERDAGTICTSYLLAYGRRCDLKQNSSSFNALLP